MVTESDMYFLAAYHNMTVYYYKYGSMEEGRYYQLEINPYFTYREQDDVLNRIDGRWIDMDTGLYIDITAARYNTNHPRGEGILFDKHGHEFRVSGRISANNVGRCSANAIRTTTYTLCGRRRSRACRP